MEEKQPVESITDDENIESEKEPSLHDMPKTSSLLENFRMKLKEDEIRRRELKVVKVAEFSQTESTCLFQISHRMALKLTFILTCALAFVTIFVWHLSAYVSARRNDELSDLLLKEKLDELKNLKSEMQNCNDKNEFLMGEIRMMENQLHETVQVFDNSITKSRNKFFEFTVAVMNAIISYALIALTMKVMKIQKPKSRKVVIVTSLMLDLFWCLTAILIHFLNSYVDLSPQISSAPIQILILMFGCLKIIIGCFKS